MARLRQRAGLDRDEPRAPTRSAKPRARDREADDDPEERATDPRRPSVSGGSEASTAPEELVPDDDLLAVDDGVFDELREAEENTVARAAEQRTVARATEDHDDATVARASLVDLERRPAAHATSAGDDATVARPAPRDLDDATVARIAPSDRDDATVARPAPRDLDDATIARASLADIEDATVARVAPTTDERVRPRRRGDFDDDQRTSLFRKDDEG